MSNVKMSELDSEFLKRAQRITSFNITSGDFTSLKYKSEIQFLFHTHFFPKFDLSKTISGQPDMNSFNNLVKELKRLDSGMFNALHKYNLQGVGPGEATLFFLLDDAHLGGGASAGVDVVIGSSKYEVKAGNFNAKQQAFKDFKLGGTVNLTNIVKEALEIRDIIDPGLKMSRTGVAEKNGVNGTQIEAILENPTLSKRWNNNVEEPYRRAASTYLNKNPLLLMVNETPKANLGELYHIGRVDPKKIFVDVVTQGTIKPKIKV